MKSIVKVLVFLIPFTAVSQSNQKFVFLENTETGKIKKLNMERTWNLTFNIDTLDDGYSSYKTYYSGEPSETVFRSDTVEFICNNLYTYTEYLGDDINVTTDQSFDFTSNKTFSLGYTNQSSETNIYITRQSKFRAVMFGIGGALVYSALVNAVFLAPMVGLNNGSFNGYSFSRFGRSEMYSGIGLSVGIPLMLLFQEKEYYFQSADESHDVWQVVESDN